MHARSALFDVYGDHLRERGDAAPVSGLVRLMASLGVTAPAVRTAVSRMVRQGWLNPVALPGGRGYAATARCVQRLDEAYARIYRLATPPWDSRWHLVVLERVPDRGRRERLRAGLRFLGYASLADGTWVAARPAPGLDDLLAGEGVRAERFFSAYDGDAAAMVGRAWNLARLADAYERWLADARQLVRDGHPPLAEPAARDEAAFATRCQLVHEWRKFLFTDPGLPPELLPVGWPGERAAAYFTAEAERLRPAASRHVDRCLAHPPTPTPPALIME